MNNYEAGQNLICIDPNGKYLTKGRLYSIERKDTTTGSIMIMDNRDQWQWIQERKITKYFKSQSITTVIEEKPKSSTFDEIHRLFRNNEIVAAILILHDKRKYEYVQINAVEYQLGEKGSILTNYLLADS